MLEDVAKNVMPIDVKDLRRLGIDEISLVKGQGKFIVVLVDIDSGKLGSCVLSVLNMLKNKLELLAGIR
ncbi:MAG: hypothetical protein HEQ19_30960 [Gloeotrichia echinulata CP02]